MVSMFTGRYLTTYRDRIPADATTIPEVFRRAGYRTVGVAANILLTEEVGFGRGFEHYDPRPAPPAPGDVPGTIHARDLDQLTNDLWQPLEDALVTDDAGERPPLFLYVHAFDPHDPYERHEELDELLPAASAPRVEPLEWQSEQLAAHGPPGPAGDPDWELELRRIHFQRALYDQEVRYTDDVLRRTFARLDELGVLDGAIVAVLSDHGEGLWEHVSRMPPEKLAQTPPKEFFYQKHGAQLYREAIETPFLLVGPGVPPATRITDPVENVDFFPTLLELADLPAPTGLHGQSLVPLLAGGAPPERGHAALVRPLRRDRARRSTAGSS